MIPNVEEDLKRSQSSSAFGGSSFLPDVEKDLQRAQQNAEAVRVAEEEKLVKQAERSQQISEIEASGEPYIKAIEPTLLDKLTDIWTAADTSTWGVTQNTLQFFERMPESVPEYNEEGALTGVRLETEEEAQRRIERRRQFRRRGLEEDSATAYIGDAIAGLRDPTTWMFGVGSNVYKAAAIAFGTGATESTIQQLVESGEVDPKEVGLVASLSAVLGGGAYKVVDIFKNAFSSSKGNVESSLQAAADALEPEIKALPMPVQSTATDEGVKLLPAPEVQKLLPAPEVLKGLPSPQQTRQAPITIDSYGIPRPPNAPSKPTVFKDNQVVPSSELVRSQQMERMWAQRDVELKASKEEAWSRSLPDRIKAKVTEQAESKAAKQNFSNALKPESSMTQAFAKAVTEEDVVVDAFARQRGNASTTALTHLASTASGGLIGFSLNGEEGAVLGAAGGLSLPLAARMVGKQLGKISEWANEDHASSLASAWATARPAQVLKGFGTEGRRLANMMRTSQENIDIRMADHLQKIRYKMEKISADEMQQVRKLLNHTISPSQTTRAAKEAATIIRKELNSVLDDAVTAGVISAKKAAALKDKAKKDGYFPRIYDNVFLSSSKGKKEWVDAWASVGFSNATAMRKALGSLLNEDSDLVTKYMQYATRDGERFFLPQDKALQLLNIERHRTKSNRSNHLENARKIPEEAEQFLEPFLIKDPAAVLASYFNDTGRRIEFAKMFDTRMPDGTQRVDGTAIKLFEDIESKHGPAAADTARETYYSVIGDTGGSTVLKQRANLSDQQRKMLSAASSYQTITKLGLAQVAGTMQATINGMVKLLNATGGNPFATGKILAKGYLDLVTKEGKDFAERTGAALETSLHQTLTEGGIGSAGAETTFLKYTGFLGVEKLQRNLGSNLGRAYAEDLVAKHTSAMAAFTRKPTKRNEYAVDKLEKQMEELGLPVAVKPSDADFLRAGLRFSNEVNFRNTADKMPLAWQSPYAKLFTKFKSFAFHQAAFVKDNVIKPMARGNAMPFLAYAGIGGTVGMGIDEIRRQIRSLGGNKPESLEWGERYLRGLTMIGGMGLVSDMVAQVKQGGASYATSSLAGPMVGDVFNVSQGALKALEKADPDELLEAYVKTTVFPGKEAVVEELKDTASNW
jgi:hypothetical protein